MIVHLLKDQTLKRVLAKCGYEEPWRGRLSEMFSAADSRVTCENCKPIKQVPGKPRRYRIKKRKT